MKKAFLQEREGHRHRRARIHLHDVLPGARSWKIGGQPFIVSKEDRARSRPALSAGMSRSRTLGRGDLLLAYPAG